MANPLRRVTLGNCEIDMLKTTLDKIIHKLSVHVLESNVADGKAL